MTGQIRTLRLVLIVPVLLGALLVVPAEAKGKPDRTPPTVSITSPVSGTTYTSSLLVTITASASDNVGVSKVEFYDGSALKGVATNSPYTYPWSISSADNGTHSWTAKAYDASNNSSVSAPVTLNVNIQCTDCAPPTGTLRINGGAAYTGTTAATLGLSATDAVGVTGYYVSTSSTPPLAGAVGSPGWTAVASTQTYSVSLPYALAAGDGSKTVYAWYKDAAGNVSLTASATILLDQTAPSNGTLTATAGSGQVSLSWSGFADTGSGLNVSSYKLVYSTGSVPASCSAGTLLATGVTSYVHTGLANGTTYYYRVCVADNVGNFATGATASATPGGTNQPPVANAGPNQSAQTLTSLTFNGSGSSDPDGTIASYAWTFGDGATASGVIVSHAYAKAGTYTATLTVTDNLGAKGSATATVTVMNRPPVANAGPDQAATVGVSVTFNGSGSSDPDGTITSYYWNFGDGISLGSGSVPTISHTYNVAGVYNATLTVTDNNGATATDQAVITVTSAAAGGAFQWAKRFGSTGTSSVIGYTTAVDTSGNVIVAGTYSGTVNFGGGTLTSAGGSSDIFVAKFTSAGAHIWSKSFGGTLDDVAYGVAVDGSGNVVVVGYFKDTINFGGGPLVAVYNGIPPQHGDAFVAKFSSSGAYLWSRSMGSWSDDVANGVAVDGSGNVFVVGTFLGNADFGGVILQSSGSTPDIFLAKYSAATGQLMWAKGFGNTGVDAGNSVAVDGSGNVIMTGLFRGTVDFGGGALTGGGSADIALAKYSPDGVHLWSKAIGGTSNDDGYAVKVDGSGNVILTGYVGGTVDFGGGPTASIGSWDTFVAKYSPTGGYLWAKRFGGTLQDEGLSIAADASGNVFVAGSFQGTADFGTGPLTSVGSWDIFASKYSAAGTALWSKRFGSTGDDFGYAIAADGSGNAIVTGAFQGTVDFGGGSLTSTGWSDMFLLKLGP